MNKIRVGQGYDSHRFEPGRPLKLGGVVIPDAPGLKAHSDGDALIHAIVDALLGATAKGDVGEHFPDTDSAYQNVDSATLLAQVVREIASEGWLIGNLDCTVICEKPKLRPHIPAIRARLAALLNCSIDQISVKGKTNEGMDAVGAGEGLAAHVAILLVRQAALGGSKPRTGV